MINSLQKWLIEPSGKLIKAEDRRQAKLLSILLLVTMLAVVAERVVGGNVPIGFLFVLLIGYGVSRTPYFHLAAVGSILVLGMPSFLVIFTLSEPTSLRIMASFMWLIVPILLSSVFLSIRETAVIIGLFIVGIILLPLLNPTLTWSMIWGALGLVSVTGIIVLIVMRQRDLIAQDQQADLRASEEQLHMAMSAGELGIWSWDLEKNWVNWSAQTEQIFGLTPGDFDNTLEAYQAMIYPADRAGLAEAIRTALDNPGADYIVQHRILLPTEEVRWVEARGRVSCDEVGKPVRFTGTVVDITLRRQYENEKEAFLLALEAKNLALQHEVAAHQQTEAALRQSEESARNFQQQLIALQKLSIELTQAETFDDLCRQAVELGCGRLEFDRLGIWFFDESDMRFMFGSYGIDEHGQLRDERHRRLPVGPAEVFDSNRPVDKKIRSWRRHELYDDNREIIGDGWSAVAPLWRGDKEFGFISVDNLINKRPFSPELLELLGLYASTLSHLFVQKQEEMKAQRRREMLEKVVELGKVVTQVADLHECLLKIYESTKTGLGFDRVGLFLFDDSSQLIRGTFGTDREGNMVEEWHLSYPAIDVAPSGEPILMTDRATLVQDYEAYVGASLHTFDVDMSGVKQHLRVISWVGERPVAVLNADNLITEQPISDEQVEALQLFAGYAGLAIENARLLAEVQGAEQRYRSIFEQAIEGIFQVADDGHFLSANPGMAHMLGFESPAQLIDNITNIGSQVYANPEQQIELQQQLLERVQVRNFEFEARRRDGSLAWLSQNVHSVYDDQGQFLYFEGTVQDVTDRKIAEVEREALIQEMERRNAELERFTYTVSHDLKSPLITIQGFLGFVKRDALAGDIDQLNTDIVKITQATERMQQLLDELLELSRVGRLVNPSELVPFNSLVEEAFELVSGRLMQRGVQVVVAPDLPTVFVDRRRLVEVLQNLLDNGAKFMGDQPEPHIDIGVEVNDMETVFFVRDNGMGIVPEYHETVFGLFERLDQSVEGTGIGLALVKRIIEVHNGRLWVESAGTGQGSTFYFTLPIADTGNKIGLS